MGLAARQEGKGIRVIRIDAKLLSERTSFDQLDWNEKQPRRSRLLTKRQPREHRTQTPSNRIGPCGELMPPGLFGSTTIDCSARMGKANTSGTAGATGVVVASKPGSKMAPDITDGRAPDGNLRLIRPPRRRCSPAQTKRSNPSLSNFVPTRMPLLQRASMPESVIIRSLILRNDLRLFQLAAKPMRNPAP